MSKQSRHQQLLTAGWIYDDTQDRYRAPESASDGTATLYNQAAAWEHYQADQLSSADDAPPTRATRAADPRKQEPQ